MNKVTLGIVLRNGLITNKNSTRCLLFPRWYSKKDSNEAEQTDKSHSKKEKSNVKNEKSQEVLTKLNSLLKQIIETPPKSASMPSLELAKPIPKRKSAGKKRDESTLKKPLEEKIVQTIVKEVAESLGGDTKQTESDLMKKFLNNSQEEGDAVSSLSDIFRGMKIDRSQPVAEQQSRSQQVKQLLSQTRKSPQKEYPLPRRSRLQPARRPQINKLDNVDLFGGPPLGIFTENPVEYNEGVKNVTWDTLKQREMKLAVTHPPSNYFQQMILWTQQGKLWKFPIDNEQGMEEEQKVSFIEHIFLEKHLEPWCPPKGPIRHFMELVCVGLSKNPYLSASAKKEHIDWYRNYFEDKSQLLQEVGAGLNEVIQIEHKNSE